jgi:hypothetical protein
MLKSFRTTIPGFTFLEPTDNPEDRFQIIAGKKVSDNLTISNPNFEEGVSTARKIVPYNNITDQRQLMAYKIHLTASDY